MWQTVYYLLQFYKAFMRKMTRSMRVKTSNAQVGLTLVLGSIG